MSRVFGSIRQVAYVTRDMDESIRYFTEQLGIGPWFVKKHFPLVSCAYKGTPIDIDFSVALANSGPMQLEIIQQHNEVPSVYRDFLRNTPSGLHVQHLCFHAPDVEDYLDKLRQRGYAVVQEGVSSSGKFAYCTHGAYENFCIEVIGHSPVRARIFETIESAARNWDGKDPVREFPSG
jgi:catechol 2,3-dioxygenase-like lactoylglutathione lyase family enzyme